MSTYYFVGCPKCKKYIELWRISADNSEPLPQSKEDRLRMSRFLSYHDELVVFCDENRWAELINRQGGLT